MIAQAAAIQDRLTRAGFPAAEVHRWWHEPRRELDGLSPAAYRDLYRARAGAKLLDLAESEPAADLKVDAAGVGAPAAIHADPIEGRASTWTAPEA